MGLEVEKPEGEFCDTCNSPLSDKSNQCCYGLFLNFTEDNDISNKCRDILGREKVKICFYCMDKFLWEVKKGMDEK